jgi:hypothetical protein
MLQKKYRTPRLCGGVVRVVLLLILGLRGGTKVVNGGVKRYLRFFAEVEQKGG